MINKNRLSIQSLCRLLFAFVVASLPITATAAASDKSAFILVELQDEEHLISSPIIRITDGRSLDYLNPLREYVDTIYIERTSNLQKYQIPIHDEAVFVQVIINQYNNTTEREFYMLFPNDTIRFVKSAEKVEVSTEQNLLLNHQIKYLNDIRRAQVSADKWVASWQKNLKLLDNLGDTLRRSRSDTPDARITLFIENLKAQTTLAAVSSIRSKRYAMSSRDSLKYLSITENIQKTKGIDMDQKIADNSLFSVNSMYRIEELISILCGEKNAISFKRLIKRIDNGYNGVLRERLLLSAFRNLYDRHPNAERMLHGVKDSFVEDTLSISQINKILIAKTKGSRAYPFVLYDDSGKEYHLDDFKGKIIVAHFWFYGCGACSRLTGLMEPIVEKYRNSTDEIVFMGINVDRDPQRWKKGVESSHYVSTGELNLAVGELGTSNPLLMHYQFKSFPKLLIIDKHGNLIAANPPTPMQKRDVPYLEEYIENIVRSSN